MNTIIEEEIFEFDEEMVVYTNKRVPANPTATIIVSHDDCKSNHSSTSGKKSSLIKTEMELFSQGELQCSEKEPEPICFTCNVDWSKCELTLDCKECGDYGLTRPCPRCHGKCQAQWKRDLKSSHVYGKAMWKGHCNLAAQ